jgi:ABC-type nitrate/sulfonate/bicarbonate transport system ATPase subunit
VAIARALVKQPKVVLADEPTGNLDEDTRDDIMGLLEHLWRDTGMTLVLVTHDSAVARRAQRIGITQHGKLSIRQDTRARRPERPGRAAQGGPGRAGTRPSYGAAAARTRRSCPSGSAGRPSARRAG